MKVCPDCLRCYDDIVTSCTEHERVALSQTRESTCEMIPGYRLESLVECGPRGEVYRAKQMECAQSCLITIRGADAQSAERFLIDAQVAAMLFQPGIADTYEFGALESGEVFVVAEDPDGQTLREFLDKNGVPPLLESVLIIRQAAEALHAIHTKGLLHRAIRPENIILTTDLDDQRVVRIQHLDLAGIAQHATVSNKFLIDSALDTLRYFAPEQSSGEDATVQTDVYSLGIVFYEMLAGAPPFDASKAKALIAKHRSATPPDIKINNFDLRMLVTHALFESLQKRPDLRQSTADLLARQLRHIEQLATHVSTPPPAVMAPRVHVKQPSPVSIAKASISSAARPNEVTQTGFPSAAVADAPDPVAPVSVEPEPKPPTVLAQQESPEVQISSPHEHEPKRSRLKLHRKRTHPVSSTSRTFESVPAFAETVRNEPAQVIVATASVVSSQRFPTKIEWEQPDDDIPTLEEAVIATTSEVGPRSSLAEPPPTIVVESSSSEPHRIEWEQPDDDIPTIEDVLTVLASEQGAESSFAEKNLDTEPPVVDRSLPEPRHIEWGDISDDVPTLEDVTVLAAEQIPETVNEKGLERGTPAVDGTLSELRHIEWDRPDDDIPSLEDVKVAPAVEQSIETGLAETDGERRTYAVDHALSEARRIEWEQPDDDFPTLEDVMTALASEQEGEVALGDLELNEIGTNDAFSDPLPEIETYVPAEPKTRRQTAELPLLEPDLEEVTVVTPPNRIKVDLEKPVVSPEFRSYAAYSERKSNGVDYFPTILGNEKTIAADNADLGNSILTAYTEMPRAAHSVRYRSLMVGGGFVALIAFFLFGYDPVKSIVQISRTEETAAAKTKSERSSLPPAEQTTTIAVPQPTELRQTDENLPRVEAIRVGAEPNRPKPADLKETTQPTVEKPSPTAKRTVPKTPLEPSTLVITSEKGSVKTRTESDKGSSRSSSRTAGVTRPRIVSEPKP